MKPAEGVFEWPVAWSVSSMSHCQSSCARRDQFRKLELVVDGRESAPLGYPGVRYLTASRLNRQSSNTSGNCSASMRRLLSIMSAGWGRRYIPCRASALGGSREASHPTGSPRCEPAHAPGVTCFTSARGAKAGDARATELAVSDVATRALQGQRRGGRGPEGGKRRRRRGARPARVGCVRRSPLTPRIDMPSTRWHHRREGSGKFDPPRARGRGGTWLRRSRATPARQR